VVFKDKEAGKTINGLYVGVKLNGNKDKGAKEFQKKYAVIGYPTVLLLKDDGTEVDRIVGFGGTKDAYLQKLRNYAAGRDTLKSLLDEEFVNASDPELQYKLAQKYVSHYAFGKAAEHFSRVLELDAENKLGHRTEAQFYVALGKARDGNIKELETLLASSKDINYLQMGSGVLIKCYTKNNEVDKAVQMFDRMLKLSPDDTSLMNKFAWTVYKQKWSNQYAHAIEIAGRAVELDPKAAAIWDTLSWLYAANGNQEKAIHAMEHAIAVDPNEPLYKQGLEKIKGGKS